MPPSEVSDAVPPELDGLVMRSLAKDPDDRFQSAEEMRGLAQYGLQMLHEQGGHTGGLEHRPGRARWRRHPGDGRSRRRRAPAPRARRDVAARAADADGPPRPRRRRVRRWSARPPKAQRWHEGRRPGVRRRPRRRDRHLLRGGVQLGRRQQRRQAPSTSEPKDKETTDKPSSTPTETEEEATTGDNGGVTPSEKPSPTKPTETESSPTDEPTGSPSETETGGRGGNTNTGDQAALRLRRRPTPAAPAVPSRAAERTAAPGVRTKAASDLRRVTGPGCCADRTGRAAQPGRVSRVSRASSVRATEARPR